MADLVVAGAGDFLPVGIVLVFAAFGLVMTVLWLWTLIDALRISDQVWAAAGQSKILWVILIVLLGLLGSILYVVMPRPALRRASA